MRIAASIGRNAEELVSIILLIIIIILIISNRIEFISDGPTKLITTIEDEPTAVDGEMVIIEPANTNAIVAQRSIADENSFDQLVADLFNGGESLLQKHLTKDLYSQLLDIKTDSFESTLLDCIRYYSRNIVGRADIGLFATDSECYDKFGTLFEPIINEYHGIDGEAIDQPLCDWGDATLFGFLDPNANNIKWIKIVCRRSIDGELYTPRMNETQLNGVLEKVNNLYTREYVYVTQQATFSTILHRLKMLLS